MYIIHRKILFHRWLSGCPMFVLFVRGGVTQSIEDQYLYSWLVLVQGCKLFKLPDIWFKSVKALPTEVRRDVHSLAYRL